MTNPLKFKYSKHVGYDVSMQGDIRYCRTVATLANGKTIQDAYGISIATMPIMEPEKYYPYLLEIYRQWAQENPELMNELRIKAFLFKNCVRDKLASDVLTHARALVQILNETE